jgi:hypothetical protein
MAIYDKTTLKGLIDTNINTNGIRSITGAKANTALKDIVDSLDRSYTLSFENADLDANSEIIINHLLNTAYPFVVVYDSNNTRVLDVNYDITVIDANNIRLAMPGAITGTYVISIKK